LLENLSINTPRCYRPVFSFQRTSANVRYQLSPNSVFGLAFRPPPWSSTNNCSIDVYRKFQRMFLFSGGHSGDTITTLS